MLKEGSLHIFQQYAAESGVSQFKAGLNATWNVVRPR